MRGLLRVSLLAISFAVASASYAQFLQYTPPGGPEEKPRDRKANLEKEVEQARHHLGPIRIAPWFSIHDGAYVRSLFASGAAPPSDFTVTVGAGLRAYLRSGSKLTWTAQLLPEYLYWQKQSERRRLNGRYRLGAYGYFNRLSLELVAGRTQQQQIVTPEVPIPATGRVDNEQLLAELELHRGIDAFALLSLSQQRNLVDELTDPRLGALDTLDRNEKVLRVGLQLRPRRSWSLGLGVERSQVDFEHTLLDRSNEGTAPVVEGHLERSRLRADLDVAFRSLRARPGAAFARYDNPTGSVSLALALTGKSSVSLYTSRNLVYSLARDYSYLQDDQVGAALRFGAGSRLNTRVFYEIGTNDYTPLAPTAARRSEDYHAYGAAFDWALGQSVTLTVNAVAAHYDSNLPGGDRDYRSVGATFNVGAR
jgi:hypothetical protein